MNINMAVINAIDAYMLVQKSIATHYEISIWVQEMIKKINEDWPKEEQREVIPLSFKLPVELSCLAFIEALKQSGYKLVPTETNI